MATAIQIETVSQLYVGYFNRAPDPSGLNFWAGQLEAGMSYNEIANYFAQSEEALEQYAYLRNPSISSVDGFIVEIYANLFNRAPDAAGAEFWKTQLESGNVSVGDFIAAISNGAEGMDRAILDNKVGVGVTFAEALNANNIAWSDAAKHAAQQVIDGVTADPDTVKEANANIDIFVATGTWPGEFSLTVNTDIATANVFNAGLEYTPGGNDRVNTLQDEDVLTGTGDNPTLNATIGNANDNGATTITPTLNGIETINARFTGSGPQAVNTLDLQDATGVDAVNITGITGAFNTAVAITNLTSVPAELSLANTSAPAGSVLFTFNHAAVSGAADETTLTVANVVVDNLVVEESRNVPVEGVETINLVSTRAENEVGTLWAEDLETLNISGDQDLTLGDTTEVRGPNGRIEAERFEAGLGRVAGSLEVINASELEGDLNIVLGAEVNAPKDGTSGVPVEFRYTGAKGDDTVVLTAGVAANTDVILDGGEGENTLVTLQSLEEGAYTKFQNLEVRGQADGGAPQHIEIDTGLIADLKAVTVRNEGQEQLINGSWVSDANNLRTDLDNVNSDVAKNITVEHGTTENNGLAANQINVSTVTAATTVGLSIEDGVNTDPRFNVQLNTSANVKNVSLNDGDSESNTVELGGLNAVGNPNRGNVAHLTGTLEVTGGKAGQFLNLDAAGVNDGGAYGYNTTGANGSFTETVENTDAANPAIAAAIVAGRLPAGSQPDARDTAVSSVLRSVNAVAGELLVVSKIEASEQKSDLVARLGASNVNAELGSGNDTLIFAVRDGATASSSGLTSGDTVKGGAGTDTIVLDGTGANLLGASEWTNLSGVDQIRLAGTAANYTLRVTDQLIDQTDAGDRITIINNDGDLTTNAESVATIDLRSVLSPNNNVTFVGANGDDRTDVRSVQTVILNDQTAVEGNHLNGGDRDIVTDYTSVGPNGQFANAAASDAAWLATGGIGNNNVLQIFNTAQVTVSDLTNTENFARIEYRADQAALQTLNLTLDNATVDALVDASHIATVTQREVLTIQAYDSDVGNLPNAALNVQAGSVGAQFNLNVTGAGANDVIVAGAGNDTINGGAGNDTINGGAGNDTINGGAGNDTITGGVGADILTGGAGADVFNYGSLAQLAADTGLTLLTADTITDFVSGTDTIKTGLAGTSGWLGNYTEAANAANFGAALAGANAAFNGFNNFSYYLTASTADNVGLLFVDTDGVGGADAVIALAGINQNNFSHTDIVA